MYSIENIKFFLSIIQKLINIRNKILDFKDFSLFCSLSFLQISC